jgi:hypothetical protein
LLRGRKQLVWAAVALLCVAALTSFAQSSAGQRLLRNLGIAARYQGLTELAFTDPGALPNTIRGTPQDLALPFTITNLSSHARSYLWFVHAGSSTPTTGEVSVPADQAAAVTPRFKLGCRTRTRVQLSLDTGQALAVWLNCEPPRVNRPRTHAATTRQKRRAQHKARSRTHGSQTRP